MPVRLTASDGGVRLLKCEGILPALETSQRLGQRHAVNE